MAEPVVFGDAEAGDIDTFFILISGFLVLPTACTAMITTDSAVQLGYFATE